MLQDPGNESHAKDGSIAGRKGHLPENAGQGQGHGPKAPATLVPLERVEVLPEKVVLTCNGRSFYVAEPGLQQLLQNLPGHESTPGSLSPRDAELLTRWLEMAGKPVTLTLPSAEEMKAEFAAKRVGATIDLPIPKGKQLETIQNPTLKNRIQAGLSGFSVPLQSQDFEALASPSSTDPLTLDQVQPILKRSAETKFPYSGSSGCAVLDTYLRKEFAKYVDARIQEPLEAAELIGTDTLRALYLSRASQQLASTFEVHGTEAKQQALEYPGHCEVKDGRVFWNCSSPSRGLGGKYSQPGGIPKVLLDDKGFGNGAVICGIVRYHEVIPGAPIYDAPGDTIAWASEDDEIIDRRVSNTVIYEGTALFTEIMARIQGEGEDFVPRMPDGGIADIHRGKKGTQPSEVTFAERITWK